MMRRYVVLVAMIVIAVSALAQEVEGLSPKAGAFSADLYTNVYFGFNLKVPSTWNVTWVAQTGPCGNECMLLDVRDPLYAKNKQLIQVTAEEVKPNAAAHESAAGTFLVQAGAKRVLEGREISAGGLTLYRTDYRSNLADSQLYQSMLVLPGKEYAAVITFASLNRREIDEMVESFTKTFSKTGH
jgi:hypothetical protein